MNRRNPHSTNNPRTQRTVLVTDSGTLGAIACIRSLGRVGYRVIACADDASALGLRSRYATSTIVHPPYASGKPFLDWLEATVAAERPDLVIPSESFLLALQPQLDRYAPLIVGAEMPDRLYRSFSKHDVLRSFIEAEQPELQEHLPATRLDDGSQSLDTLHAAAVDLGFPLYLKADALHARANGPGRVVRVDSIGNLENVLVQLRDAYHRLTIQAHAPGVGVAAFALLDGGELRASFMHHRLHEVPHTGGVSSYRRSWYHAAIHADALRRLRHLGHQGAAMVEYRWDPSSDRFWFVEVNARFWGSLHLALAAGVDFPRLLADQQLGFGAPRALPRWSQVRMRQTAPLEITHVIGCLRDPTLSRSAKLAKLVGFAALGLNPRVYSDLAFPGDHRLYWIALWRHLKLLASRALPGTGQRALPCPQKP